MRSGYYHTVKLISIKPTSQYLIMILTHNTLDRYGKPMSQLKHAEDY